MNLLGALGNAKPVSEFINTAGQYQTTQSNLETQRLMQQKATMEAAQMEKDNKEYHVDAAITAFPEDHRDTIKKMWGMSGLIDANGIMRGKDIRSTPDLYKKYPDMALATNMTEIERMEKEQVSLSKKGDAVSQAKIMENAGTLTDLHKKNAFLRGKEAQKPNVYKPGDYVEKPGGGYEKMPDKPEKPQVYKPDDFVQQPDGSYMQMPGKAEEQWGEPFTGKVGGKEVLLRKSLKSGKVEQVSAGPMGGTTVNVDTGLSKSARAKAEGDVQEATDMYKGLEALVSISKPDFFTYAGKIQAGAERVGEKAGVVRDPKFLSEYSAWKAGTEQEFNKYRKWATGVAAGEKELERLANSFPNVNMSKTQYMAAAKLTAVNAWKLAERRRRALDAGLDDPGKQKDFYKLLPLDSMPEPPAEVLQRFSPKGGNWTLRNGKWVQE